MAGDEQSGSDPLTPSDNVGKPWTSDEDKQLIRYLNVDLKHAQIADLLGRTISSVSQRVAKLSSLKKETGEKQRDSQKREDVRFLIDVLREINPVTGEDLNHNSPWKDPQIISDIKKYMDESEVIKRHPNQLPLDSDEYVKIEKFGSVSYVNEKWKTQIFDYDNARELNYLEGKLLNNRFPYTEEEFEMVEQMYESQKDIDDLVRMFQRTKSSIVTILKNRGVEIEEE